MSSPAPAASELVKLRPPEDVDGTGLTRGMLTDMALKVIYFNGFASGIEIAKTLALPYSDVTEDVIHFLKDEKFVDIRGGQDFGAATMEYSLTERGRAKVNEALGRNTYVGPCPVDLRDYQRVVEAQTISTVQVTRDSIKEAMGGLVLNERILSLVGPAANSGKSMFLFGKPGNGKTTVAERLARTLGGEIYVPHCLQVDGHIIKIFDPLIHTKVEVEAPADAAAAVRIATHDERWVKVERPFVMVGGELTLDDLDLIYHSSSKFYEAPFQLKANCGILLIDDFGRQKNRPEDLLNRWIVPLEKRVDFLTLHTGKKIEVPFDQLLIFSTNLEPADLVDEAFLRRISYKIGFDSPTRDELRSIFKIMCKLKDVAWSGEAFDYIWKRQYEHNGFEPRAVHPRDILAQIESIAKFYDVKPALKKELIDRALDSYFVKL
jgi:predicted ATPase with chaperone activity